MTDKVQKIRENVVEIVNSINPFIPDEDGKNSDYEAGRLDAAIQILQIIDSSEEPVSDDTITIRKKWFEQCKKSWYNEGYLDGKHNRDGQFGEPVSEDLNEAAIVYNKKANFVCAGEIPNEHFIAGAQWQKTKDESYSKDLGEYINELSKQFPEVSFAKLSRIAVRVAKWLKDKMMQNAIDAQCFGFQGAALFSFRLPAGNYLVGSEVKIIVVKED